MSRSTVASLEARIIALETEIAALRAQLSAKPAPRRAWQPSPKFLAAGEEYLRRRAAGEDVVVRGGVCVLRNEPQDTPF